MELDSEYYLNNPYKKVFSQVQLYNYYPKYVLRGSNSSVRIAVIEQDHGVYGEDILSQYPEEELRKYWQAYLDEARYSVVNVQRKKVGNEDSVYLKRVMGRPILGSNLFLDAIEYITQLWEHGVGITTFLFILSDEFKEIPEDERARREVEFVESNGKVPLF